MVRYTSLLATLVVLILITAWSASGAQSAAGTLRGAVSAAGPDRQPFNIPGVSLKLNGTLLGSASFSAFSDNEGGYKLTELAAGSYTLEASFQGFRTVVKTITIIAGATVTEDIRLELQELHAEVTVEAETGRIDAKEVVAAAEIKQETLQTVPLKNEQFQEALPLIPGVVRGPDGTINVKGTRASQSGTVVNTANVTDPFTGEAAISLPLETIQSVQVLTNPYAPEYGKFTGAVTSIETRRGTDKWKTQFQSFIPRGRRRGGSIFGIEQFTPRFIVGGPLKSDKLKLLQSFEYRFSRPKVKGFAPSKSDIKIESFDSFTYVLQEVDLHTHRTKYRNVAEELARELGMNYVFGVEFQELAQGRVGAPAFHGQALLCRLPISQARILRFRNQLHNWGPPWKPHWAWLQPRRGGRMALVAEVQWGGRPCVIYNAHLESQAHDIARAKQMQEILEDIRANYAPDVSVIVAGDLNTRDGPDSPVLQQLKAAGFQDVLQDGNAPLQTKVGSNRREDWIFLRHLRFFDARILRLAISDHYPLMVRIAHSAGTQPAFSKSLLSSRPQEIEGEQTCRYSFRCLTPRRSNPKEGQRNCHSERWQEYPSWNA